MHVTDLADHRATMWFCLTHLLFEVTPEDLDRAQALADDGLAFESPPAGAHVVAARVAEHRGDTHGFIRHTEAAIRIDPTFHIAQQDRAHVELLRLGIGRRASEAVRAHHVYWKAAQFAGRPPQLDDHLALVGRVLGVERVIPDETSLSIGESDLFTALLLFECGVMSTFADRAGALLPAAERSMVEGWRDVRHRLIELESIAGRERARVVDGATGEILDVVVRIEQDSWHPGESALALVAPTASDFVVLGQPVMLPRAITKRLALDLDGPELAAMVLRLLRRVEGLAA